MTTWHQGRPGDAALVYARRGWPVFPCHSPAAAPGGCSCGLADCGSPGKHPRVPGGLKAATTDESQLRRWWDRWPGANVAIRTGAVSGLVVIDVDPPHRGAESMASLVERHGPLPPCRTIGTGSGGWHLYLAHPGTSVANDSGKRLGPGIDVRGDGGYVVAPPSRHVRGRSYVLKANGRLTPAMPDWLLETLTRRAEPARPQFSSDLRGNVPSRWAEKALEGELGQLRSAVEGTRNDTLNRIAFRLGQIVATGALDVGHVEHLLVDGALAVGLGEQEATRTVHSGLQAGERYPRGPAVPRWSFLALLGEKLGVSAYGALCATPLAGGAGQW